jgi:small subunit ribosomal protein S9
LTEDPQTPEENEEQPREGASEEATPAAEEQPREEAAPAAEQPAAAEAEEQPAPEAEQPAPAAEAEDAPAAEEEAAPAPEQPEPSPAGAQARPEIPGADLEVDIVPEGMDPLTREEMEAEEAAAEAAAGEEAVEEERPVAQAAIDLAAGARYRATGKRKTAIARVILRPGGGEYRINGHPLDAHFPRPTLQRNIRQPLESVGYESRMDVVATLHGGGVSAQAGALRHGIARALIEADPNLRGELKRRGFLTRDPRKKERKKAGLKKARKRPQFSKR